MTKEISAIDKYIMTGDLNRLTPAEQVEVYKQMCEAYNLDYRLKPFEIIDFQGFKKIYFSKAGCDLLASTRNLSRKVKEVKVDPESFVAECECEITDMANDRKENEFAFRSFGEYIPGNPPQVKMMNGKKLALEKLKLISQAKRRATLAFIGATIQSAEDIYIDEAIKPVVVEQDVPKVIPEPKDTVQATAQDTEQAPREEEKTITLKDIKEQIKAQYSTLKAFTEQTGLTPEDAFKRVEAGEELEAVLNTKKAVETETKKAETLVPEFKLEEEEVLETVKFNHTDPDHKKLLIKYLDTEYPKWKSVPKFLQLLSEKLPAMTGKVTLDQIIKELNKQVIAPLQEVMTNEGK
jgi:hypothetical protein